MEDIDSFAVVRIVDDDVGVRESYKFLIESDGWLVKTYCSAEDFLEHDNPTVPGCVVLDVRMPGLTGLELQNRLNSFVYKIPVIFISAHAELGLGFLAETDKGRELVSSNRKGRASGPYQTRKDKRKVGS